MEGSEVAGANVDFSLIESDFEVESAVQRSASEAFCDMLWRVGDRRIANCDAVQRLEIMDDAKGLLVFLEDAKPSVAIRGIRRLVDARRNLRPNDVHDLLEKCWRNGDVLLDPWDVLDRRKQDRRKVVVVERSSFFFLPCECVPMNVDD